MRRTLIIGLFLIISFSSHAQENLSDDFTKNAVYFELLGNGFVYSVNYERVLTKVENSSTSIRIGGSYLPEFLISFPIEYLYNLGGKSNHLELGICYSPWFEYDTDGHYEGNYPDLVFVQESEGYELVNYFMPRIGYRYQKPSGGFLFKIAMTPPVFIIRNGDYDVGFGLWGGISMGYSF